MSVHGLAGTNMGSRLCPWVRPVLAASAQPTGPARCRMYAPSRDRVKYTGPTHLLEVPKTHANRKVMAGFRMPSKRKKWPRAGFGLFFIFGDIVPLYRPPPSPLRDCEMVLGRLSNGVQSFKKKVASRSRHHSASSNRKTTEAW